MSGSEKAIQVRRHQHLVLLQPSHRMLTCHSRGMQVSKFMLYLPIPCICLGYPRASHVAVDSQDTSIVLMIFKMLHIIFTI